MNGGSPMPSPRAMIAFGGRDRTRRSIREGTAVMKFALHFGNNNFSDPESARRLVRLAEAAGFDSVFAVEHVVFPDNYTSVYPYAPVLASRASL
jgi:alkanesulfonate monooxygenase SsuD/methylene tetrahydromethanopterin reductase-like flavin-dependent oxidoreductase (luciferase family)